MRAALYLRSSKDRHDVSIDAQRRELEALARTRQHRVVAEFVDAVESGKDEDRPAFRELIDAIRNTRRGWDTLLVLDTSRVARRRHLALMFERECDRYQVRLLYKSLPETDPITEMLLKSILQAMDEWHSLTSRQKGLAGMRENVRQGFRAGGRAPLGYRLEHAETGKVRDGQPVRKSKLVPSDEAPLVAAFLRARAAGVPWSQAVGALQISKSTVAGMEWNAMTYAGHTVWNVHAEAGSGRKRRPRSEWIVQRCTHDALIGDEEAEAILSRLEAWSAKNHRERAAGYLLAGILTTPAGTAFHGDRGAYRVKGRQIKADVVDQAVAAHVLRDIQTPAFVRAVTAAAHAVAPPEGVEALRAAVSSAEARVAKLMGLLERTSAHDPILRQMEMVEAERKRSLIALANLEQEAAERATLSKITEHEVRRLLVERAAELECADQGEMRQVFLSLLSRVELEGDDLAIHYRIGRPSKKAGRPGLDWRPHGEQALNRTLSVKRRYKIG
jgi:site-specific DNA recombinase